MSRITTTHVPQVVSSGLAPVVGRVAGERRLSLAISLPPRNQGELDEFLTRLYDPQSPDFHQYLSMQEFTERFGPTEADFATLREFARAHGLTVVDEPANRMVLDVEGSAAAIESTLHISLSIFQHPSENRTFYAPDREPTPDLDIPLLHISGLDDFAPPRPKYLETPAATESVTETGSTKVTKAATGGSGPNHSYLGSDLRSVYYGSGPLNGAGQSLGIFSLSGYNLSDVQLYFSSIDQPLNVPIVGVSVNGASLTCLPPSCNDTEQSLDLEQAISMAPGLRQVQFYVGNTAVSVLNRMASDNTSKTLSCSWGWGYDESSIDPILQEMAAQGQSFFVATGDQGSNTPANVVWPSDDPWVTAVGGTALIINYPAETWKSETGWVNSAGMPSPNNVPIPSYQLLPGVITAANDASSTLRNIPDISSQSSARQYNCSMGVCHYYGAGTSYAAPLWAGLIAMANQQSVANGGSYVGFLNPALYQIGTGSGFTKDIHDITSGSNGAYTAVSGYDLVTGWGSPKGVTLINALVP
jgi:subtilase family serine protease